MATKTYTNGTITVLWNPNLCSHSGNCVRHLPQVFKPKERPWVNMDQANSAAIIAAVAKCLSGALSIQQTEKTMQTSTEKINNTNINCLTNGPLIISGDFTITDSNGKELEKKDRVALCRCGLSSNKPFCDGRHKNSDFKA